MEGYTARTAGLPTFSEEGPDHPYLWLENARSDDAPQMNTFQEAVTTRCAFSSRFATVTNLVLLSLLAFVPGTHAEHLFHGIASFHNEQEFTSASAAEGLVSNTVNQHCRHLGTPDTFRNDQTIDKLSARSSLATAFVADESDESLAGIDAKPRINSISGAGATIHLASFFQSTGETPSALFSNYSTVAVRPTASNLKKEIHVNEFSRPSKTLLSSTQVTAMKSEEIVMKVRQKIKNLSEHLLCRK